MYWRQGIRCRWYKEPWCLWLNTKSLLPRKIIATVIINRNHKNPYPYCSEKPIMSSMNPLSIPGGWSKDKDKSKDSPAATEQKNTSKHLTLIATNDPLLTYFL